MKTVNGVPQFETEEKYQAVERANNLLIRHYKSRACKKCENYSTEGWQTSFYCKYLSQTLTVKEV